MKKIRVAQIMGKMNHGGVEAVVMNYFRNIDKDKFQFDFIVDSDSSCPQKEEIEKLGGNVIFVKPYKHIFKYMKNLKSIFNENKYDVVHAELTTMSGFSLKVAKKCNVPVRICHGHNTSGKGEFLKNILKSILKKHSWKYANEYFACSEHAAKWLFGKKMVKEGKTKIIYNAIELDKFYFSSNLRDEMRNKFNLDEKSIVIGNIGRFVPQKNQNFLLDVFYELHKDNSNLKLLLIGEGKLHDEIVSSINKYKLEKDVILIDNTEKPSLYYNMMDCFIYPSLYEGFGLTALEAQVNGLKCVVSNEVPDEVCITKSVTKIDGFEKENWINVIKNVISNLDRIETKSIFESSKFDLKSETPKLEKIYINGLDNNK